MYCLTLDFASAILFPGVNSRGELVPSHGATRRRLVDKNMVAVSYIFYKLLLISTSKFRTTFFSVDTKEVMPTKRAMV